MSLRTRQGVVVGLDMSVSFFGAPERGHLGMVFSTSCRYLELARILGQNRHGTPSTTKGLK